MKRRILIAFALALAAADPPCALAEEGRFDAEIFRPSADPRDLIMVQKSEVHGHLSPTVGFYFHYALNPLSILNQRTGVSLDAITGRLTLIGVASIGFWNWVDLGVAVPFVAFQQGQDLSRFGSYGSVDSQVLGDIRVQTKIMLPYLNRRTKAKEGFGMAINAHVNFPTGRVAAFSSDGTVTGGVGLAADYRFNWGLIIAANGGAWFRPDRNFLGTRIGNMASFGLAAEMIIVRKWLLSIIAEGYGYIGLTKFPDSKPQLPIETILGLRWHTTNGFGVTLGLGFGADCGFGQPSLRFFTNLTWHPKQSREQEEIDRLRQLAIEDPDHDGLIDDKDKCPQQPGPPENGGCPDEDSDADGIVDRLDKCPDIPGRTEMGKGVGDGCISAEISGNKIVLRVPILFATDESETIKPESYHVLEDVAWLLKQHVEIALARVEAHTDSRGGEAHNLTLSQQRAASVVAKLKEFGIAESRMRPEGYGSKRLLVDDRMCRGYDPTSRSGSAGGLRVTTALDEPCRLAAAKNRRVEIVIEKIDHDKLKALPKGLAPASDLPSGELPKGALPEGMLKSGAPMPKGELPSAPLPSVPLPSKSGLPSGGALPSNQELPSGNRTLDTTVKEAPPEGAKPKSDGRSRRHHDRNHDRKKDGKAEAGGSGDGKAPSIGDPRK